MIRSDTDTWDLANSVGITTTTTCAPARAIATRAPDPLGRQKQTVSPDQECIGAQLCTSTFTGRG